MKQKIREAAIKWFNSKPTDEKTKFLVDEKKQGLPLMQWLIPYWVQEVVIPWWNNLQMTDRWAKTGGDIHKGEEHIATIYLKEQETREVSNVSDGILSDEEAARRAEMDFYPNNEAGAFDYMDEVEKTKISQIFSNHTELMEKDSKPVSVEEAATNNYSIGSLSPIGSRKRSIYENKKESFIDGAKWHKKQSEELIKELLEALYNSNTQMRYLNQKFKETGTTNAVISINESAITKAEQYLNK